MSKNISKETTSPDGRFKIINTTPPLASDHFYGDTELEWKLIDTETRKTIMTFDGDWSKAGAINDVVFSKDGMEVLAKENKKIIKRVELSPYYNK